MSAMNCRPASDRPVLQDRDLAPRFPVTGILVMAYTILASAGVLPTLPASKALPLVWITLFALWAGGIHWVRRRYP